MKVFGVAGSPRKNGNTDMLLAEFMRGATSRGAETKTVFLRDLQVAPCQHCDACLKAGICKIKDDMQAIYKEMEAADIIVLASPVQFMGVTAPMKAMIDRCQALWVRKYVLKAPPLGDNSPRKGFLISVGGRRVANLFEPIQSMIKTLFIILNIRYAGDLLFREVDEKGAIARHPDALKQAFAAGQKIVADTMSQDETAQSS